MNFDFSYTTSVTFNPSKCHHVGCYGYSSSLSVCTCALPVCVLNATSCFSAAVSEGNVTPVWQTCAPVEQVCLISGSASRGRGLQRRVCLRTEPPPHTSCRDQTDDEFRCSWNTWTHDQVTGWWGEPERCMFIWFRVNAGTSVQCIVGCWRSFLSLTTDSRSFSHSE